MKVVFFDVESTDLEANWGRLLCASFSELDVGENLAPIRTVRRDLRPYIGRNKIDDSKVALAIRKELEASDMIVGWNSILFDVPLVNARLAAVGERPIRVGERYGTAHIDLMYYAGGQSLRIGSRRLDNVARFFSVDEEKTVLDGEVWQLAAAGDSDAMDAVVEHCETDIRILKAVWPHLAPNVKKHQFTLSEVFHLLHEIPSRKHGDA